MPDETQITELKKEPGHLPAKRTAAVSWCLKCGRGIVLVYGKGWESRYPNDCVEEKS